MFYYVWNSKKKKKSNHKDLFVRSLINFHWWHNLIDGNSIGSEGIYVYVGEYCWKGKSKKEDWDKSKYEFAHTLMISHSPILTFSSIWTFVGPFLLYFILTNVLWFNFLMEYWQLNHTLFMYATIINTNIVNSAYFIPSYSRKNISQFDQLT